MGEKTIRFGVLGLVAVLVVGLVFLGVQRHLADQRAVAAATLPAESPNAGAQQAAPQQQPAADLPKKVETIFVHVVGAVASPGVYELPAGSRAVDAVKAAGGASPEGSPDSLPLAQLLSDGDKIWVPTKSEATAANAPPVAKDATVVPVASRSGGSKASGAGASAGAVKVNINTASETELAGVPGIGATKARAIVEYRKSHGRFTKIEDLDNVKGIGPSTIEKIRAHLTL